MAVSPWVESNLQHVRPPPAEVLDLACGRGRHVLHLLALGYKVTAVDRDPGALAVLRKRVPAACGDRLTVICADLESTAVHAGCCPVALQGRRFSAVLVINYLFRPLLQGGLLLDLLEPGGILIYEAWALGNEAYAAPRSVEVLLERSLKPNELLEMALPRCEVFGFSHGRLESYEGRRECAKQMLCARLRHTPSEALVQLLAERSAPVAAMGSSDVSFVGVPEFGRQWLHCKGAAPALGFGLPAFLEVLAGYDPEAARETHLERMRSSVTEGVALPTGHSEDSAGQHFRLWSASMVRRVPSANIEGSEGSLQTETVSDDAAIRAFLSKAMLTSVEDLESRGDGWTFIGNQLEGAAFCLRSLRQRLFCSTGLSGGINGYLTPSGAIGKPPHVDDHDIIVLQQAGAKIWSLLDAATRQVSAEVCLQAGDVLYLPQGVPHHARAESGTPSLHLAVGLHRTPMSWAAVLAALITLRGLGGQRCSGQSLPTSFVEEMDTRRAAFAAFGGRDHWLNQLLPARLHLVLIAAVDPEDLPSGMLQSLAEEAILAAASLARIVQSGPAAVAGDSKGGARQRELLQASAAGDLRELQAVSVAGASAMQSAVAEAFWSCRELVADQHYALHGPWAGVPRGSDEAGDAELRERRWRRLPGRVAALLRPGGGTLRINGYRLPGLSAEESGAARYMLGVHTGAACSAFSPSFVPGDAAAVQSVLDKLVRVGALEPA